MKLKIEIEPAGQLQFLSQMSRTVSSSRKMELRLVKVFVSLSFLSSLGHAALRM